MNEYKGLAALLDKADLTLREAAPLFKVSPTSLNTWVQQDRKSADTEDGPRIGPQQELLRAYGIRAIKLIRAAVEAKDLPLNRDSSIDRAAALVKVWKKHLSNTP